MSILTFKVHNKDSKCLTTVYWYSTCSLIITNSPLSNSLLLSDRCISPLELNRVHFTHLMFSSYK